MVNPSKDPTRRFIFEKASGLVLRWDCAQGYIRLFQRGHLAGARQDKPCDLGHGRGAGDLRSRILELNGQTTSTRERERERERRERDVYY